jgi:SWIM zinc finger
MLIDTSTGEVTIFAIENDVTLNVRQLQALIDLLEDGEDEFGDPAYWGDEEGEDADPFEVRQEYHPGWVYPHKILSVLSSYGDKPYCVVHLEDGTWACSCPHWIYRLASKPGERCKHILAQLWT